MPKLRPEPPIIHIYAPRYPEDLVEIIGNDKGLKRLIAVMIAAVNAGRGDSRVCTSDGHESAVSVTCLPGSRRPEEWSRSGSPCWDVDDPLVARILDLTEENHFLRQAIATLRHERKSIMDVEGLAGTGTVDDGPLPTG